MLDVIGAGATARSTIDWHSAWMKSPERQETESQLQEILREGRETPVVEEKHMHFAAPFSVQLLELTRRAFLNFFRNPTYLISKYVINIFAGKHRNKMSASVVLMRNDRVVHWFLIFQGEKHPTRGTNSHICGFHGYDSRRAAFEYAARAFPSLPVSFSSNVDLVTL